MSIQWKGVMPAVTTQFTMNDKLDLNLFKINIKAQLDAGVHGIVLGGTLGEASTLTDEEKRILTRETVALVDGNVPVLINIAEQTTNAAIALAKTAEEDGAKGLMILPPMRYNASDVEIVEYFKEVLFATALKYSTFSTSLAL